MNYNNYAQQQMSYNEDNEVMQTAQQTNPNEQIRQMAAIQKQIVEFPHVNIAHIINYQYNNQSSLIESQNEPCDFTLADYFKFRQNNWFTKEEILNIISQIVQGYMHLKQLKIAHRDLNPNILLIKQIPETNQILIKISDFGVASYQEPRMYQPTGTPFYQAPEIRANYNYDDKCDIYSLGLIIFQMCFKNKYHINPITMKELENFNQSIKITKYQVQNSIDPTLKYLIESMIVYNPNERISWEELANIKQLQPQFLILHNNSKTKQYYIDFQNPLGKENQGMTFLTFDLFNPLIKYCTKQINKNSIEGQREIEVYNLIKFDQTCENIIRIEDICYNNQYVYLVMEKCNMDIEQYFEQKQFNLSEEEVLDIFQQIVTGYLKLMSFNLILKVLKPQNILVKQNDQFQRLIIKLIEFGVGNVNNSNLITTYAGIPIYTAPEIIFSQESTNKCDMFSLGVIMYQLVYGRYYFEYQPNSIEDLQRILYNLQSNPVYCKPYKQYSNNLLKLIEQMLIFDQYNRIDWFQLDQQIKEIKRGGQKKDRIKIVKVTIQDPNPSEQLIQQQSSYQQQKQPLYQQQQQPQYQQLSQSQFQQQQQQQQYQQSDECDIFSQQITPSYQQFTSQSNNNQQESSQSYNQANQQYKNDFQILSPQIQIKDKQQSNFQFQPNQFLKTNGSVPQFQNISKPNIPQQNINPTIPQPSFQNNFSKPIKENQQIIFPSSFTSNLNNQTQPLNPNFPQINPTVNLQLKIQSPMQTPQNFQGATQIQVNNWQQQVSPSNPTFQLNDQKITLPLSDQKSNFKQSDQKFPIPIKNQNLMNQFPSNDFQQSQKSQSNLYEQNNNNINRFETIPSNQIQEINQQKKIENFSIPNQQQQNNQLYNFKSSTQFKNEQGTRQTISNNQNNNKFNYFAYPLQQQFKEIDKSQKNFEEFIQNAFQDFHNKINQLSSQPAYIGFYICILFFYQDIINQKKNQKGFQANLEIEKQVQEDLKTVKQLISFVDKKNGRLQDLKNLAEKQIQILDQTTIQQLYQQYYENNKDILLDYDKSNQIYTQLNGIIQKMYQQTIEFYQNKLAKPTDY